MAFSETSSHLTPPLQRRVLQALFALASPAAISPPVGCGLSRRQPCSLSSRGSSASPPWEQAIRRGSRGRKPAKAVTFDKAERRRPETANKGQVQLRSGLYLLLADFSGCTSLTTCRQRLGSVMISTPGHRVFRGSRSRALPASVPSVGGAVLRRSVALPSPRRRFTVAQTGQTRDPAPTLPEIWRMSDYAFLALIEERHS